MILDKRTPLGAGKPAAGSPTGRCALATAVFTPALLLPAPPSHLPGPAFLLPSGAGVLAVFLPGAQASEPAADAFRAPSPGFDER